MNLKLEDLCLNAMESALAFYDDLLNADISKNPNKAMNAIDAVEWPELIQYELDILEERGVYIFVPDEGQYMHDTKWVFKRKSADDQPIKWRSRLCLRGFKQKITRLFRNLLACITEGVTKTVLCSYVLVRLPMRPD